MEIREIKSENELKSVLELCYSILPDTENSIIYGYKSWVERLSGGLQPMIYAVEDDKIVAAVLGRAENEDSMIIGLVACDKNYRRRGITKKLMLQFEKMSRKMNYKYITLGSKEDAFYDSCGYKIICKMHGQNIYQKIL